MCADIDDIDRGDEVAAALVEEDEGDPALDDVALDDVLDDEQIAAEVSDLTEEADDEGPDAGSLVGLPEGLLDDDWSSPASGAPATWRDIPIQFVEAYKPTLVSQTVAALDSRAVGYTRESSDDQSENSQPRQLANIKAYAKRAGLKIQAYYADLGVTGTSTYDRHQFKQMMADARKKKFKVIIVEDLDRFGRSLPDILEAFEELRDLGIEIHNSKQGRLDLAHLVLMGYVGAEGRVRFLDLCKGGKRNAVLKGLVMHAPCYGYRKHPSRKGVHIVVPERAEVVRLIFKWVKAGVGSKRIADELTKRAHSSPRQVYRADNNEVPEEGSLPWDASEVRGIVKNPIYAGWNIWGRTTPRRDRKTRRIIGTDRRPCEDWVVSRVPTLALVSVAHQAHAIASLKTRSFGGASSANRAGTRLLAGCLHCAVCGSPMHVATANNTTLVYYCSDHRSSRLGRCAVAKTVRLDFVERLMIATIAARVGEHGNEAAYRARFRSAFEAGDGARKRRVAEIDRVVARLKDDLKASYLMMVRQTGVPAPIIAEVNEGMEKRICQLNQIRDGLVGVATPQQAFQALATLKSGMAQMAAEIPFRPLTPEGEALAQIFRRLVGLVLVHPRDENDIVRLELEPNRDRVTKPKGFKAEEVRPPIVLTIDVKAEFEREAEGRLDQAYAETLAAAEAGVYALSDAVWAVIKPLVAKVDLSFGAQTVNARQLMEGAFLILKTRGALSRVPAKYGDPGVFHKALKRVVYANAWDAVVAKLREEMPLFLLGTDLARLNTTSYARAEKRRVGKLERWNADECARRVAKLDAAAAAETDPVTLRRMKVTRLRLTGLSSHTAAETMGIEVKAVYEIFSNYRLSGIPGLRGAHSAAVPRRVAKIKPSLFSQEHKAKLRKIVETKVDLNGQPLTFQTLLDRCADKDELGIVCSKQTVRRVLRDMGIDLPTLIKPGLVRGTDVPDPHVVETDASTRAAETKRGQVRPCDRRRRGREPHRRRNDIALDGAETAAANLSQGRAS